MSGLVNVVLPVFLVLGFGYLAAWRRLISEASIDGVMRFAQTFAIPVLLARSIARLDLGASYDAGLMVSFYVGAFVAFGLGIALSRLWLDRTPVDAAAIGFCCLFSNALLLGIPITERAYGHDALDGNFAIISIHSPLLFTAGILTMEATRSRGAGLGTVALNAIRGVLTTPMVIGILCGFAIRGFTALTGQDLPEPGWAAIDMVARAALPAALFALGGVLVRYKPAGDGRAIAMVTALSLVVHPAVAYALAHWVFHLPAAGLRSVVMSAAMAPGVNTYIFANMYGAAKRVAASSVLVATALSVLTIWAWLAILP